MFAPCTDFPRLLVFGLRATVCEGALVAQLISCCSPVTIQVLTTLCSNATIISIVQKGRLRLSKV